ncbi:MAG TPA: hypothetical protein VMI31_12935, partial [Fimbriimonadaceae bacterium]|nr:hypothetical protein [Fimbriimonadaceae bacterium]
MRFRFPFEFALLALAGAAFGQGKYSDFTTKLGYRGLNQLGAYDLLKDLTSRVGARLTGSPEAAKAVTWARSEMERLGFQDVRLLPCMAHHWVRGKVEKCSATDSDGTIQLACCALGGSPATPGGSVTAPVIEVHSVEDCAKLGDQAKGKIIFFNRPFDNSEVNTFAEYGGAVDQRIEGPAAAAKVGAAAVLV